MKRKEGGDADPPAAKAAVEVPAPLVLPLTVFKSFNSVHEDPFQSSVSPTILGSVGI